MTQPSVRPNTGTGSFFTRLIRQQVFIPIAALLLLVIFHLIVDPTFFRVSLGTSSSGNPVLLGNIVTIFDRGTELALLSIGMTLVTASSGGQDISVGASVAISGSVVLRVLCGTNSRPETLQAPVIVAFLVCIVVAMLFGAFNGTLVSCFKIQPMVATLILFTAGRSIAAWINNNELPIAPGEKLGYFGNFLPGFPVPTPILISVVCFIVTALVLRFTNLGLYAQAVGINKQSARLNGLNPVFIQLLTYILLGLFVGIAGFVHVSRLSSMNYSNAAKDIEMDAILAVALGGNALSGGKFNMTASILGAYVIQFLTTTLYRFDIQSEALSAYKAVVVIVLVLISAPVVREKFSALWKKIAHRKSAVSSAQSGSSAGR